MHIPIRVAVAVAMSSPLLAAQVEPDTLIYAHAAVIVKASGLSEAASRSASFAKSMSEADLRHLTGVSIDRAVRRSGLIYVRDRGGRSSVTTIGLRGHASTQTEISLNGFSLVNQQNGLVDIGLYPIDIIGRIVIIRGSQSAFVGSGGIGGTVQLLTSDTEKSSAEIQGGAGSYGFGSLAMRLPLYSIGLPLTLRAGYRSDKGAFPFDASVSGVRHHGIREGNGSRMLYALAEGRQQLSPGTVLSSMVYAVDSRRGSPGPVSTFNPSDATLSDRMLRIGSRIVSVWGQVFWEAQVTAQYHWESYVDRSLLFPLDDAYTNRGVTGLLRGRASLSEELSVTAGIEAGKHDIEATMVSFPGGSDRFALFAGAQYSFSGNGPVVYPSARLDMFSELTPLPSWKVAIHQEIVADDLLTLRFGIGTGFRMPSFNERYWISGGNPGLRHETALMVEGGFSSRFKALGIHEVHVIAHWSEVQDKIVGWPPANNERSALIGGEFTWTWTPKSIATIRSGIALAEARSLIPYQPGKQFPYIPRLTASGEVILRVVGVETSASVEYASRRYTTIDNVRPLSSDPYTVLAASVVVPASATGLPLSFTCFIDNLLNARYEIVKDYPMPGRTFHVTASVEFQ